MENKFKVYYLSNDAKARGEKAKKIGAINFGEDALVIPTLDLWHYAQELNYKDGLIIFADYQTNKPVHAEKV